MNMTGPSLTPMAFSPRILVFILTVSIAVAADSTDAPAVLMLCSYHAGHLWTDRERQGETEAILEAFPDARIYTEFMDWKRFPFPDNKAGIRRTLEDKYRLVGFDLVLTNDNAALEFAIAHRSELFPGLPIVFAGINGFADIAPTLPDGVTGVAEAIDPKATLATALAIHPGARRVVVVTDSTPSGLNTRREVERVIEQQGWDDISFEFTDHLDMSGLRELVSSLGDNALVYMTYFNRDRTGTFYGHEESVELVTSSSSVPVYQSYEFALGHGIVGGHLLNGRAHGRSAGELGVKILQGANPDSLSPMSVSPCPGVFDATAMKRFGISRTALPAEAKVINQPEPFWVRHRWLILAIALFSTFQMIVIGVLVANILRRRRAERELKLSEARFRELIERAPLAIFLARDMDILYANEAMARLSGYSQEELVRKGATDVVAPEYHAQLHDYDRRRRLGEDVPVSYEIEGTHRDGTRVPLRVHVAVVTMSDGPASVIFIDDLTGQKKAEAEKMAMVHRMEHAQKMESLGVLAGGIAHDFNNLLAGISANAAMTRSTLPAEHKGLQYLIIMEKAVQRASQIARQLLTFARGGEPVKKIISLKETVTESAEFALRGACHGLQIDMPATLRSVNADAGQLGQVINNLVLNASQAMEHAGVVQVWGENVALTDENDAGLPPGVYVRISVRDTGRGVPHEELKRIFDPFYTTKAKGSGLGLSTAYFVARAHGGGLTVDSEPGTGSTFHAYFPASSAVADDSHPPPSSAHHVTAARVLVMDDEDTVRRGIEQMLHRLGHRVDTAPEGGLAVEMFKTASEDDPYDLAILDLTVRGGKGGKETLELLKELDPHIKAIAMSGYSTDNVFADPQADGFRGSLPKPFGLDDLSDTIAKVLSSRAER